MGKPRISAIRSNESVGVSSPQPFKYSHKGRYLLISFSPFAPESQGSVLPAARYKAYHSSLVRRMSAPLQRSFSRPASVVPDTA